MPRPFRFLGAAASPPYESSITDNPEPITINSDFVFVFTAILCALICILGLIAVARCAWLRRFSSSSPNGIDPYPPPSKANKALKKKILRSLPKLIFTPESATDFSDSDCVICLSEFAAGDEIRVLPHCAHAFHLPCIDKWLASHSSCPSCRRILDSAGEKCEKCGNFRACSSSGFGSGSGADAEARLKHREDSVNRFLR